MNKIKQLINEIANIDNKILLRYMLIWLAFSIGIIFIILVDWKLLIGLFFLSVSKNLAKMYLA